MRVRQVRYLQLELRLWWEAWGTVAAAPSALCCRVGPPHCPQPGAASQWCGGEVNQPVICFQ